MVLKLSFLGMGEMRVYGSSAVLLREGRNEGLWI